MAKRSITQRWLLNSLGVILLILIIIEIGFTVAIQNYYYSSAKQYLTSRSNIITSMLLRVSQDSTSNYSAEIRNIVETFDEKEQIELMAINNRGDVTITSSGFSPPSNMDMTDYKLAVDSSSGTGYYVSQLESGEKVMSVCVLVPPSVTSEYAALKMVTSLKEVDGQIISFVFLLTIIFIAIILLMIFSGLYFVKSIVIPIRQIGSTARQFATGDFSERIPKKRDDELGELCEIINSMADELSKTESMKNEFISSVSHELRTPLTAIKGWSETLYDIDEPETIRKGMRVITNETERLSQMVEELLDFSRMQNGRFTLMKSTMDILAELGEAVLIYQDRAYREQIKVIYYEPEMLPFVFGDKNRLRQVFINILDNAIKYSDPGDTITIEAYEENNFIHIDVSDTGCGISETDLPKVKTKFYKANHSRRGSGIGLAVADEIINMHGGSLELKSEQNVGTTVKIKLPAAPKKAEVKQDNKSEQPLKSPETEERKEINE